VQVINHSAFDSLEELWSLFEKRGTATPYQTLHWTKHWSATVAPAIGMKPLLLTLLDDAQKPLAILPLGIQVLHGLRVVRFLGGKHANYNMPVFAEGGMLRINPLQLAATLQDFGKTEKIDLFVFDNLPTTWSGSANPLAGVAAIPSPSSAWKCSLKADGDAMISGLMSSESRKKLRNKEKRLSEFGPIAYKEASTQEEAERFLAAFLQQKAMRFAALGIDNAFTDKGVEAFLAGATAIGRNQKPSIALFGMLSGERILAVFGGASHAGRYTGMFTSFDTDPAVSRFSPGDLLLINLIKHLCAAGLHTFDLGTGEATYKNDYCDTEEPLVDCMLPVTLKGQLAVKALALKQIVKRRLKRSGTAMRLLTQWRKLRSP
jgi:CelD/BcsL family acetyltransferase involved in cellulose biosynthesis